MRTLIIGLALTLTTLMAWAQPPVATATLDSQVPSEVVMSTNIITAWAFGMEALTPDQEALLLQELEQTWAEGDVQSITMGLQLPGVIQRLQMLTQEQREQIQLQMREALIQNAQTAPNSPSAQVVRELIDATQAAEIWPPPLTEEIFNATERLVAWSFGYRSLPTEHRLLLLEAIEARWAAEDRAVIELCEDIPQILAVILSQPERVPQNQAHWRQWMMRAAAQRPEGKFAQLISQLIGQPIEIWGAGLGEVGPVPNVLSPPVEANESTDNVVNP